MSHLGRSGTPLVVSVTLIHTRVHSDPRFGYAAPAATILDKIHNEAPPVSTAVLRWEPGGLRCVLTIHSAQPEAPSSSYRTFMYGGNSAGLLCVMWSCLPRVSASTGIVCTQFVNAVRAHRVHICVSRAHEPPADSAVC